MPKREKKKHRHRSRSQSSSKDSLERYAASSIPEQTSQLLM